MTAVYIYIYKLYMIVVYRSVPVVFLCLLEDSIVNNEHKTFNWNFYIQQVIKIKNNNNWK